MDRKERTVPNLDSKDYDVNDAGKLDYRMEAGKKDAIFFHLLGLVATVAATIWMYSFGTCDPSEMKYFLGMPMWISGAIVIYLIMFASGIIYLSKWEDFPLSAKFLKKSGGLEQ